jgi:ubiquinone/menaquinone biosynthesis C-methylase UbiE
MKLSREFTNLINLVLDNLLPPPIRDSKAFMGFLMRAVLGPKYRYYMEFKDKLPHLSEADIENYYALLADTTMPRDTDLNKQSIKIILNNLVGESVLDVGCGRGYLSEKIAKTSAFKTVHGLDYAPPQKSRRVIYQKGTIYHLPYEDASFDTVICAHTLEHVPDIQLALSELKRVTQKRLIIVLPKQREYKYTFDLHIHFFPYLYTVKQLISEPNAQYYEIARDYVVIINYT